MTNSLPAGTRNTSLNLIDEEYQAVMEATGQAGSFYKEWALIGLKSAAQSGDTLAAYLAAKIEAIRAERLRLKHGIIVLLALCIAIQFFAGDPALRGLRRTRRNEAVALVDVEGEEV